MIELYMEFLFSILKLIISIDLLIFIGVIFIVTIGYVTMNFIKEMKKE